MIKKLKVLFFSLSLLTCLNLNGGYLDWWNNCPFQVCCCSDRLWVETEYLYWKIQNSPKIVPLVLEGPSVPGGTPVLGQPGYTAVLGDESLKNPWRSGGRFTIGYWFDDFHCYGTEINYFFLSKRSTKHSIFSNGSIDFPFFTFPFFDVETGEESSSRISAPGLFSGKASIRNSNMMLGGEWNALATVYANCCMSVNVLIGFRYWNFDEKFHFNTSSPFIPPFPLDIYKTTDKFHTENNFYSGQIGAKVHYIWNRFFLDAKGKIAFGAMRQHLNITGELRTNDFSNFGPVQEFVGGYIALPTNIGHHRKTCFAVLPEVNFDVGYYVTDDFKVKIGYGFLYVNNVLWAGRQIDRNINPSQSTVFESNPDPVLIGKRKPKAQLKSNSLWAQGLTTGFEFLF